MNPKDYLFKIIICIPWGIVSLPLLSQDSSAIPETQSQSYIYQLSKEDLLGLSPQILANEIGWLKDRETSELKELKKLQQTNQLLCELVQRLNTKCPARQYLVKTLLGESNLCTDSAEKTTEKTITVTLKGDEGQSFRLLGNSKYVSTEFSKDFLGPITFARLDSRLVKPPRFMDLVNLQVVTIVKKGQIGDRTKRPANLELQILIDGQPLLSDTHLMIPEDSFDQSTFVINPKNFNDLRQQKNCQVTIDQIAVLSQGEANP